jgi:hypothetical protein
VGRHIESTPNLSGFLNMSLAFQSNIGIL